jgi:hypothetical protein
MRKLIFIIILMSSLHVGFSQVFNFGIGGGLTYNNLWSNTSELDNSKYKFGFQINAIMRYEINNKFGLRFEPGYANRGSKYSDQNSSDSKINLNYLIFPVTLDYSLFDKIFLIIGPELSLRLSAEYTTLGTKVDIRSLYDKDYDIGINIGVLYMIINRIGFGLKYNRSFFSIYNEMVFSDQFKGYKKIRLCDQGFVIGLFYLIE